MSRRIRVIGASPRGDLIEVNDGRLEVMRKVTTPEMRATDTSGFLRRGMEREIRALQDARGLDCVGEGPEEETDRGDSVRTVYFAPRGTWRVVPQARESNEE